MISILMSRVIILTAGTLYPAYRSYKAVRTKDVREYVKWMMYWIVFALFCFAEALADVFVAFWFPFYYELKIMFVIWLLSPWTKGASILYRKWVHPTLSKHEREIDAMLEHAKNESYNQVVNLGSKGLLCARDIVATAALRGQMQLVQQIQRSYSMNDVSRKSADNMPLTRSSLGAEIHEESGEENEEQVRTWAGSYDDSGRKEEHPINEQLSEPEEIEPDSSADPANPPVAPRRRSNRSAPRDSPVVSETGPESIYATMPRRSARTRY
uniref:Receptor expression-enhancing protein n=1 Tax=Steinernema glaseri TaxID=37863 RepID=A0A1I7ZLS1_9BILA